MKSPGHREHPEHKVIEHHIGRRMVVKVGDEVVADSHHVVEVDETGNRPRFYFPRSDVRMDHLARTDTTSKCPFKGEAHYFSLRTDGHKMKDAVWTYEDPYEEHAGLKDRVAFWDEKFPELSILEK